VSGLKTVEKASPNIQIASQIMNSYRKKNRKDIKHYFFNENDFVNKKRTNGVIKVIHKASPANARNNPFSLNSNFSTI
jgi:hypothetical protein